MCNSALRMQWLLERCECLLRMQWLLLIQEPDVSACCTCKSYWRDVSANAVLCMQCHCMYWRDAFVVERCECCCACSRLLERCVQQCLLRTCKSYWRDVSACFSYKSYWRDISAICCTCKSYWRDVSACCACSYGYWRDVSAMLHMQWLLERCECLLRMHL